MTSPRNWAPLAIVFAVVIALSSCNSSSDSASDAGSDAGHDAGGDAGADAGTDAGVDAGPVPLAATLVSTRFTTADQMRAAIELQVTGEPFAQLLGYQLPGFDRTLTVTDQYADPSSPDGGVVTDPLGYSLAVETYEYSKQPMNNLSFESGAGLSLLWGPRRGGTAQTREAASAGFSARFQTLAYASIAAGRFRKPNLITEPPPVDNPLNTYGWPGLWPQFAEFRSFDPAIAPAPGATPSCTFSGAAGALGYGGTLDAGGFANYECDYNSLNLPHRDAQVDKTLAPDALGYATWKQSLWLITYWQSMQDFAGNPVKQVSAADEASVGVLGNGVVGQYDNGSGALVDGVAGTYLGDNPMEGWQGLTMLEEIDNKTALVLSQLLSHDGLALTGAASIKSAIDYAYDSPLLYLPAAIAVTETSQADAGEELLYFPKPTAYAISDARSSLAGLNGLIGGMSEAFATSDQNNPEVGGAQAFRITYRKLADGGSDLFAHDNGLPDGEDTVHDRTLGALKIMLVDLDRLHLDSTNKVLVDDVSISGSTITRGTQVSTLELGQSILSLRTAYRALNGSLVLYSNDTPDTLNQPSALDGVSLSGASYSGTLAAHVNALVRMQADFLLAKLIGADGAVANGYDLSTQKADAAPTSLEAEAMAIRALLEAYLATSDQKYRTKAIDVYADLGARFWQGDARLFRTTAGIDSPMKYTPVRVGVLEGALRQYYKLVASAPARAAEGAALLQRLLRVNKVVLNGWDDFDGDRHIGPNECLAGRLQLGERVLTGEQGLAADLGDRDHDCVKEISVVGMPAALGAELDVTKP
ncbi:MAG: hypothetical protein JST92_17930 [Deltaproteobacteria bacterium]|nr:hypothetical protein [Deltaproteobacteria bacterium]